MITIDGAAGEGGGQVLRSALTLALVTGQPFRISNIRGGRAKPGLMRQHLTAVEAACAISGASCDGAAVGASELTFRPGPVRAGNYHFAVGTAGSTGLVLQTVLMPLVLAGTPSRLVLEGGTHNMMAPPFEFVARCFLPVINRLGPHVEADLIRYGFYPRGGGRVDVVIDPAPLRPFDCPGRGALSAVSATALIAGLPVDIAERELRAAARDLDWPARAFVVQRLPDDRGPGNALLLEAEFAQGREIVTGFGRIGVSAESLARTAAKRMAGFIATGAFAGPYLADQLLLPLALAGGGSFVTVTPSAHTATAADVIAQFTGRRWQFDARPDGTYRAWLPPA